MAKAKVVRIHLYRAEGPTKVLEREGRQATVSSYEEADRKLKRWAETAPEKGGYDKTDFEVEWEDGETYKGRYDLTYEDHKKGKHNLLGHQIQQELLFRSGLWRPEHLTPEQYERYLENFVDREGPSREDHLLFLQTHET